MKPRKLSARDRDTIWVIVNPSAIDDDLKTPLYWSNTSGWGYLSTATFFTDDEHERFNLPMGGRWIKLPIAILKLEKEWELWECKAKRR